MFSVFRMGPASSGRGLCDIDSPEKVKNSKNGKHSGIQGGNFSRTRTSQFLIFFWAIDITQSASAAGRIHTKY